MALIFVRLTLLTLLSAVCVSAQPTLKESVVHDDRFKAVLREFVRENLTGSKESGVPVLVIKARTSNTCEAVLSAFAVLFEFEDFLPNNYVYIDSTLLLVYDGSEQIFRREKAWYNDLKRLVSPKLCDNTQILVPSGPKKEVGIPCTFKFDPQEKKLTFKSGKLVDVTSHFGQLFD